MGCRIIQQHRGSTLIAKVRLSKVSTLPTVGWKTPQRRLLLAQASKLAKQG